MAHPRHPQRADPPLFYGHVAGIVEELHVRLCRGKPIGKLDDKLDLTLNLIKVRDGGTPQSPLIGRYCSRSMPLPVLSLGNELFVRFRSDYSVASSGFRARYETGTVS